MQLTASTALRVRDEIWLYYGGANYTHGGPILAQPDTENTNTVARNGFTGSIGLVTWKLDRFVAAEAPAEGSVSTTVPLKFAKGKRLEINAAASQKDSTRPCGPHPSFLQAPKAVGGPPCPVRSLPVPIP